MGWIKLDDNFLENRKIDTLSSDAKLLYLWGLLYSSRQMTDGFIPAKRVDSIEQRPLVQEIVAVGIWKFTQEHGFDEYEIHDYLKHQSSKAKIEEVREKNREKLSIYRAAKRNAEIAKLLETEGDTELHPKGDTELHPSDVTTPEDDENIKNPFEKFWNIYPRKDGKKKAQEAFKKALKTTSIEVILEGVTRYIQFLKTVTQDTAMPATWLNGERWNDEGAEPQLAWNSAKPEVPHHRLEDPNGPYCGSCFQAWPCNTEQRKGGAEF